MALGPSFLDVDVFRQNVAGAIDAKFLYSRNIIAQWRYDIHMLTKRLMRSVDVDFLVHYRRVKWFYWSTHFDYLPFYGFC